MRAFRCRTEEDRESGARVFVHCLHLGLVEVGLEFGQHEHDAVGAAERGDSCCVIGRLAGQCARVIDLGCRFNSGQSP